MCALFSPESLQAGAVKGLKDSGHAVHCCTSETLFTLHHRVCVCVWLVVVVVVVVVVCVCVCVWLCVCVCVLSLIHI